MNKTGLIVGGVLVVILLVIGAFMAGTIQLAKSAKRIMAYDNPNANIPALRAAVAHNPHDTAAYMNLGRYDYMHHNYQAAIQELQQVTRTEPADSLYNSEALMLLGAAQKRTGHPDEAMTTSRHLATHNDGYGRNARKYVAQHGG